MAKRFWIVEEQIEQEGEGFLLIGYVDLEDDEPRFTVHFELRAEGSSAERPFAFMDATYSVENPLVEGSIILGGATVYAQCVARKGLRFTIKELKKCYRQSKCQNPIADIRQRAREIAQCLGEKRDPAKDAFLQALLDCIPLKKLFSGDDDDGDNDPTDDI